MVLGHAGRIHVVGGVAAVDGTLQPLAPRPCIAGHRPAPRQVKLHANEVCQMTTHMCKNTMPKSTAARQNEHLR